MNLIGKLGLTCVIASLLLGAEGSKLGLAANEAVIDDASPASSPMDSGITCHIGIEAPMVKGKHQLWRRAAKTPASPQRNTIIRQQIISSRANTIRAVLHKGSGIDSEHYLDHLGEAVSGLPEPEIFSKPPYNRATNAEKFEMLADDLKEKLVTLTRRKNLNEDSKFDISQELRDEYLVMRTQVIVNGRKFDKNKKIDMVDKQLRFEPTNIIPERISNVMTVNDIAASLRGVKL